MSDHRDGRDERDESRLRLLVQRNVKTRERVLIIDPSR